jgi:hypothetical protein
MVLVPNPSVGLPQAFVPFPKTFVLLPNPAARQADTFVFPAKASARPHRRRALPPSAEIALKPARLRPIGAPAVPM